MKHGPRTILLKLLTILLSGSPFLWWTRQQLTAGLIPQQSQLRRSTLHVPHRFRAISARTAGRVGTNQFQMFVTVNTKNSLENKVISSNRSPDRGERAPRSRDQASSFKQRASSAKLFEHQAASVKSQAASLKLQATSDKLPDS